ncbi:MAG: hypothetical protein ACREQI_01000 [Candidatus Binataceae bacterium]
MKRHAVAAIAILALLTPPLGTIARAWEGRVDENIVSLAVQALPASPLADFFNRNQIALQDHATEPNTVLKKRYGQTEEIRHYLEVEIYRPKEFDALSSSYTEMVRQFGLATLIRSGTLPWTIAEESGKLRDAWAKGDCADVLRQAGYLANYVGDASQPLDTTIYSDGYPQDRGIHRRIEDAADNHANLIWREDRGQVHVSPAASPWDAAIAELRGAHSHVQELIEADRAARAESKGDPEKYNKFLMDAERPLFDQQIAGAASVLASIWVAQWEAAGSSDKCSAAH